MSWKRSNPVARTDLVPLTGADLALLTQPAGTRFGHLQVTRKAGHVVTFWTNAEGVSFGRCQCPIGLRVIRHGLDAEAMVHEWHEHVAHNS